MSINDTIRNNRNLPIKQIVKIIKEEHGKTLSYNAVKKRRARLKEETGDLERTLQHELTDTGYKIYYGDTYVLATHEQIRQALMLYCVARFTLNQVALEMGWTRQEFFAIKTAFHITKDSLPFTPYEIDQLEPEQMDEIVRIEKKRYATQYYEKNKHADIVKEINRYNEHDYWVKRFADLVNAREERPVKLHPVRQSEVAYLVKFTDVHAGLKTKNFFNTYNFDVMSRRFEKALSYILHYVPVGKIAIIDCGDLVHGIIHGSVNKHSEYMIDSSFKATDEYIRLFDTLLDKGYSIEFAYSNGSHSALEKNKKDRTEEENLGRYLGYTLQAIYRNNPNVTINNPVTNINMATVKVHNMRIATAHGDESNAKKLVETAKALEKKVGNIIEIQCGHFHHYKAEEIGGILVEYTESFSGTDQFAANKGLTSPCGFRINTYFQDGTKISKFFNLGDII